MTEIDHLALVEFVVINDASSNESSFILLAADAGARVRHAPRWRTRRFRMEVMMMSSGIMGGVLVLLAYAAGALRWCWSARLVHACAASGGLLLVVHLSDRGAWPAAALNVIWATVAIVALTKARRDGVRWSAQGSGDHRLVKHALERLASLGLRGGIDVDSISVVEKLTPLGEDLRIVCASDDELIFVNRMRANYLGPPLHKHLRAAQLEYVLAGKVRMHVDGENRELTTGRWVWLPEGTPHTFEPVNGEAVVVSFVLGSHPLGFFQEWDGTPRLDQLSAPERARLARDLRRLAATEIVRA